MGKRKKTVNEIMIRDHPVGKMLWAEMSSGMLFKFKGCSAHLSIVFDEETKELSAHITDEIRDKHIPIAKKNVDEMKEIVHRHIKLTIRRYKPDSMYRQLNPRLLRAMGFGDNYADMKEYDMAPLLTAMIRGKPFRRSLVQDGLKYKIPRPGFILKEGDYYFVMPFDEQYAWVENIDIKKSPLWDLPTTKGFFAYLAYLEKYELLEQTEGFSENNMKKLREIALTVIAEAQADQIRSEMPPLL